MSAGVPAVSGRLCLDLSLTPAARTLQEQKQRSNEEAGLMLHYAGMVSGWRRFPLANISKRVEHKKDLPSLSARTNRDVPFNRST